MSRFFLTGGHAGSDRRLVCYAAEFPDDGSGSTEIFFVNIDRPAVWQRTSWPNSIVSSCDYERGPEGRLAFCALSDHGLVSISNRHGVWAEHIEGAGLYDSVGQGYMHSIKVIGGELVACGDAAQLYRRRGPDLWEPIIPDITADEQVRRKNAFATIVSGSTGLSRGVDALRTGKSFVALGEGPDGEILIGGEFGLVARVRDDIYQELRLEERFLVMSVTQKGVMMTAVGWQDATTRVYQGRFDQGLVQIAESRAIGNATSAEFFDGSLYVGSKYGLYRLTNGTFAQIAKDQIGGVSALSATGNVLWIVGHHDVFRMTPDALQHFPQSI
jgi:hypothetical protein